MSSARRNLKEACGKVPVWRTEITYWGSHRRMSLPNKTKSKTIRDPVDVYVADRWNGSHCSYPGRSDKPVHRLFFSVRTVCIVICQMVYQKSAEVIVVVPNHNEGPNIKCSDLPALSNWQWKQPIFFKTWIWMIGQNLKINNSRAEPIGCTRAKSKQ